MMTPRRQRSRRLPTLRFEFKGDCLNSENMSIQAIEHVRLAGVFACLPKTREDNLARCTKLYGDAEKADGIVKAIGIKSRRVAGAGISSLDLCVSAARLALEECGVSPAEIGAVICVTFTPERAMPCNACQAQRRLGLPQSVIAFDVGLACSGYAYGLYLAGLLAVKTGKKVLLLDGDVQTAVESPDDKDTIPLLADAGSATMVEPTAAESVWRFSFLSKGEAGEALTLPIGGTISMDGFAVFRFVATEVCAFLKAFLSEAGVSAAAVDAFIPHQANVYMIGQLAKSLGFPSEKLWVSGDELGNSASATVPVTLAYVGGKVGAARRHLLISGFGGGLSASAALLDADENTRFASCDYEG